MGCSFAHQFNVPLFIGRVSPEYFAITTEVPLVCYLNQEGRQAIIITGFDHHSFLATELAMAKLFPAFLRLTATKSADRSLFSASAHYACNIMSGHGNCLLCHSVKHYKALVETYLLFNCICSIILIVSCLIASFLLRLHLIEHRGIVVKQFEDFSYMWIRALCNQRNIFTLTVFSFDFCCSYDVVLLLLCAIKPFQEKSCTLGLLSSFRATKVKKYVRILSKKLFNDADYGFGNFGIARRFAMTWVGKIKPKDRKEWIVFLVKSYDVFYIMISPEMQTARNFCYGVRRQQINVVDIKGIHGLIPLNIIIARLRCLFFAALALGIPFFGFFLSSFLDLTAASKQRKDILTCEFPYGFISVHIIKLCFVFSFCKISANRLKCQILLMVSKDSPKFYVNYKYIMIKRFNIIFFLVICSIAIPVYAQRVTQTFNDVSMSEALKGTVLDETGQPCPMPTSPAANIKAPVPATTRNPACK